MPMAKERLEKWIAAGSGNYGIDQVRECLDNDLDTPQAIKIIDEYAESGSGIANAAMLLGVDISNPYLFNKE